MTNTTESIFLILCYGNMDQVTKLFFWSLICASQNKDIFKKIVYSLKDRCIRQPCLFSIFHNQKKVFLVFLPNTLFHIRYENVKVPRCTESCDTVLYHFEYLSTPKRVERIQGELPSPKIFLLYCIYTLPIAGLQSRDFS